LNIEGSLNSGTIIPVYLIENQEQRKNEEIILKKQYYVLQSNIKILYLCNEYKRVMKGIIYFVLRIKLIGI
jgi:hypothetical protein